MNSFKKQMNLGLFLAMIVVFISTSPLVAQVNLGSIQGNVVDTQNAAIPNANATLANLTAHLITSLSVSAGATVLRQGRYGDEEVPISHRTISEEPPLEEVDERRKHDSKSPMRTSIFSPIDSSNCSPRRNQVWRLNPCTGRCLPNAPRIWPTSGLTKWPATALPVPLSSPAFPATKSR